MLNDTSEPNKIIFTENHLNPTTYNLIKEELNFSDEPTVILLEGHFNHNYFFDNDGFFDPNKLDDYFSDTEEVLDHIITKMQNDPEAVTEQDEIALVTFSNHYALIKQISPDLKSGNIKLRFLGARTDVERDYLNSKFPGEDMDLQDMAGELFSRYIDKHILSKDPNLNKKDKANLIEECRQIHYYNLKFIDNINRATTLFPSHRILTAMGASHEAMVNLTLEKTGNNFTIIPTAIQYDPANFNVFQETLAKNLQLCGFNENKCKVAINHFSPREMQNSWRRNSSIESEAIRIQKNIDLCKKMGIKWGDCYKAVCGPEAARRMEGSVNAYQDVINNVTPGDLVSLNPQECTSLRHFQFGIDSLDNRGKCETLPSKQAQIAAVEEKVTTPAYLHVREQLRNRQLLIRQRLNNGRYYSGISNEKSRPRRCDIL